MRNAALCLEDAMWLALENSSKIIICTALIGLSQLLSSMRAEAIADEISSLFKELRNLFIVLEKPCRLIISE